MKNKLKNLKKEECIDEKLLINNKKEKKK